MNERPCRPGRVSRARFLRLAAASAAGVALAGCALFEDAEIRICSRAELEASGFIAFEFNGDTAFAALDKNGQAYCMSLVCTHKQCTVKYRPEEEKFVCPCHKGEYDKAGAVLKGKPPAPLNRFKTEWRGEELWALNQPAG